MLPLNYIQQLGINKLFFFIYTELMRCNLGHFEGLLKEIHDFSLEHVN